MSKPNKKPANPSFVTPTGIARYPWLNKPDAGNDRVQKRVPEYHVTLRFKNDDPEFVKLVEKLQPVYADCIAQKRAGIDAKSAKKNPIREKPIAEEELDEDGNETGWSTMRFKMNSEVKDKKSGETRRMEPAIVDGKKRTVKGVSIYGGSKLKVAFSVAPFHVESSNLIGATYYLNAVQIVELAAKQNGAVNAFDELDNDGLGDSQDHFGEEETEGETGGTSGDDGKDDDF